MKKLVLALMVGTTVCVFAADEGESAPEGTQKVVLKISTVETVGLRTQKTWNPPAQPLTLQEMPYSESDIQNASPEESAKMIKANRERRLANQKIQASIAIDAYQKASEHYEAVKKQLEGTVFGKQVILAVDKFAGAAGENFDSDCIEFFHRMDNDEGEKEQFLKDMNSAETLSAPYFIKLIFDNPREESGKVVINGQEFKKSKLTVGVSYQVQNLSGKIATSGNVKKEKTWKNTGAVMREGIDENGLIDLMEEALVEVAKRINSHFVAKITVSVVSAGGKKDKEFDAEGATLEIDGTSQELGDEISIMTGKHTIVVELDGYKQKGAITHMIKKSSKIKIVLKKEQEKKAEKKVAE